MSKNKISINTKNVRFPAAPDLYGLFFEDINRAADGGLYPEMIRNRSFEDSLIPEGCTVDDEKIVLNNGFNWAGAFHGGEGVDEWAEREKETPVPAWYSEHAAFRLQTDNTLNAHRKAALSVQFEAGGYIENVGYCGVPAEEGKSYNFFCFIKSPTACDLSVSICGEQGVYACETILTDASGGYLPYTLTLTSSATDYNSKLRITAVKKTELVIGFTSLLPVKTYKNHGLREDLVMMLKNTHSKFIRFPGGCVVEGINEENTLAFHKTIGPVYERESSWVMWHYRTTNGLGFHEYMQLCEDLEMEALYVVNCGISCQGRGARGYSEEKTKEYLQEALDAMEYALGPENSKFGSLRKKYGHPEPFKLKYVEIGNENGGPEYFERYKLFYDTLKAAYPDVIYISNAHTEYEGLPTEYADEHYYNSPEYFSERETMFNSYDRKGPKILIGEYAVYMLFHDDDVLASQQSALGESVFLAGCEKNQDVVTLTAYAPLLQNCNYIGWRPDLIVFDNHRVYGIPSYHAISLMGKYHGTEVVEINQDCEMKTIPYAGVPGVMVREGTLDFKNVKINGKPVETVDMVHGRYEESDGTYTMIPTTERKPCVGKCDAWNKAMQRFAETRSFRRGNPVWAVFGEESLDEMTYEIDIRFTEGQAVNLNIWNSYPAVDFGTNEPKGTEWTDFLVRNQAWHIEDGSSSTRTPTFFDPPLKPEEKTPVKINYGEYNHCEIRCDKEGYSCYLNGEFISRQELKKRARVSVSCEMTEDEIYVKLINIEDDAADVDLILDCGIEKLIKVERVTAPKNAVNSFECPENVSSVEECFSVNGSSFTYSVPGNTVAVLVIKKA